ncbi:MAG: hypothetical protein H0Z18_04985 [Thermococcus sp.]|uniref:hypothetical protein n=1 Tax=Thermococcus sp. TaxID=35749 RepID=UPI001D4DB759|nr:hypothetical protein [Thermococcus sp.]MBO8174594.1 hypothetical protein [Thermococcus sp.]
MGKGFLNEFFSTSEKTAKIWRQLIEYIHPEGDKALEKYRDFERGDSGRRKALRNP